MQPLSSGAKRELTAGLSEAMVRFAARRIRAHGRGRAMAALAPAVLDARASAVAAQVGQIPQEETGQAAQVGVFEHLRTAIY